MKFNDANLYGLGDYVFINKRDWAIWEARLKLADELVDHILTSGASNPELELATAYMNAGDNK